jgi:signal transduction histidine kinase
MPAGEKYWLAFSRANIIGFLLISLVPLLIWSAANYFLVRSSFTDLTLDLLESKRNQFMRNVNFLYAELESIPTNFEQIDAIRVIDAVSFLNHFMNTSLYLRKDGERITYNWQTHLRPAFDQPFTYDPVLNRAAYSHIHGRDTLLIIYSIADLLTFSGIADTSLQYQERVAYIDPPGQIWEIPGFAPLFLRQPRLFTDADEIFRSFNYYGWSLPLQTSPDRHESGRIVVAYNRTELFASWTNYQYYFPLGILFFALLLTWLAIFVGMRLGNALRHLQTATTAMGRGNFDMPIRVRGSQELAALGHSLEQMRIKLRDIYSDLEKAVNERTLELQETQVQLIHQEKMASVGMLAAGVAHEIGNPLTSISSIVQLLKRRNPDQKTAEHLTSISTNIERISRIVRELVDVSRPSQHVSRRTNMNDIVRTAVGIVRYDQRATGIDFFIKTDPELPEVEVVEDQLIQVFINILVNAIDALEKGPKRIEVWTRASQDSVFAEFRDSGKGIPLRLQKRVFEPFYTSKEVGKGTGLGLSVSYGIIRNFGGEIKLRSEVGMGSTFSVILPRARSDKRAKLE